MSRLTLPQHEPHSVPLIDPSEYRPEYKKTEEFRNYAIGETPDYVVRNYRNMHKWQTLDFARKRMSEWGKLNHAELTIMEALDALNALVDESDPDVDIPNAYHAFQTAEGIREKHPDNEWLQLTGLIHDIGKMLALWGEPQWAVVGDTYPLGCAPSDNIVFGVESFEGNPDSNDAKLNTQLGIYEENCGLNKLFMTWGHDEYMYRVLRGNTCYLPEEAFYIIRFHSFYPWHTSGAYDYLSDNKDREMLKWIHEFNQFDLYTKRPDTPHINDLIPYYQTLVDKYLPGKLRW